MAKGQSRTPGRDVRGGSGKRGAKQVTQNYRAAKGQERTASGGQRQDAHRNKRAGAKRGGSEADLVIGRHAVHEALVAGVPLKSACVLEGADATLAQLARELEAADVPVERVSRQQLDAMSGRAAHQGVVVRARPFEYAGLRDVLDRAGEGAALVVVLDHVTDQGNLGAIIRSAEVVGAAGVIIANARAAGVGVGAYKASAGAVLHIPVAQVSNLARAVEDLKEAGFWACAASEHAEQDVWHASLPERLALVMGSEGQGVSQLLLKKCDLACRLPQRGVTESLNVAQAATVMCYEWLRGVSDGAQA